ncbi:MAG: LptF/LptG family permease [Bacteroidales bacterium]|jgi:lipopolysaccharide export system permease protein|nr:LptF/LptG family permease [Bacteroidales bacterium]
MKKIDYYIIKKFLGTFFYAIALLTVIIIIFDVSEKIEDFIENEAPLNEIVFSYYLNFIPYFINLFSYLFVFITVIFFTSKLASQTEIIAMLSAGISFRRLLRPYLISAGLLGALSFALANFVIPHTNIETRAFKQKYIVNLQKDMGQDIHFQMSKGIFVYIERYHSNSSTAFKFSLEQIDSIGQLIYKLNTEKAIYDTVSNKWKLINYYERYIDGINEELIMGKTKDTTFALTPKDLIVIKEDFEEMDFIEIRDFVEKQKLKGAPNVVAYEIEMHKRIAFPFAAIILTVIGVSLSSRKVRGGIGVHLGAGIALTFIYILLMQFTTVFAISGTLSPQIAAWVPNIIYIFIALYLLKRAPK